MNRIHSAGVASSNNDAILPDTFPAKTYLMIESCDREDSEVACWNDDGDAFIVKDTVKFAATHLPKYFKHSNFQSFVRQLNLYGFRNVGSKGSQAKGNNQSVIFRHENFHLGRRDLLQNIHRAKKGNRSARKAHSVSVAEEKKEEITLLTLSEQIGEMSLKLDLLLSLMRNQNQGSDDIFIPQKSAPPLHSIGKRRRHEIGEYRVGSPASVSDVSSDSLPYAASAQDVHQNNAFSKMEVVEESKEYGSVGYDQKLRASGGELEPLDIDDEFTEFIDTMLEDNSKAMGVLAVDNMPQSESDIDAKPTAISQESDAVLEGREPRNVASASEAPADVLQDPEYTHCSSPPVSDAEEGGDDEECGQSSEAVDCAGRHGAGDDFDLVSNAAANKVHPATVGGEHQQYADNEATIDAIVTHAERVEDSGIDEENGGLQSSPPLAEAVEVVDESSLRERFRRCRGFRLYLAIASILVLIAFIVWPVTVVLTARAKNRRKPPPPPPRRPGPNVFDDTNEIAKEKWKEGRNRTREFGEGADSHVSQHQKNFLQDEKNFAPEVRAKSSPMPDVSNLMEVALNGMRFQCQKVK